LLGKVNDVVDFVPTEAAKTEAFARGCKGLGYTSYIRAKESWQSMYDLLKLIDATIPLLVFTNNILFTKP